MSQLTPPEIELKRLESEIEKSCKAGRQVTQEALDAVAAQRDRVVANNAAIAKRDAELAAQRDAEQKATADRFDAAAKAEGLAAWLASGGEAKDFESAWPALRAKIIEARTLAKLTAETPNSRSGYEL